MKKAENEKYLIVKMEDYKIKPDRIYLYEKKTKKIKLLNMEDINTMQYDAIDEEEKEIAELCYKNGIV